MINEEQRRPGINEIIREIREAKPNISMDAAAAWAKEEWYHRNDKSDAMSDVSDGSRKQVGNGT